MTARGRILITGNAGMHLGAYMKGGTIEVTGNSCGIGVGEMTDGLIRFAAMPAVKSAVLIAGVPPACETAGRS